MGGSLTGSLTQDIQTVGTLKACIGSIMSGCVLMIGAYFLQLYSEMLSFATHMHSVAHA